MFLGEYTEERDEVGAFVVGLQEGEEAVEFGEGAWEADVGVC